MNTEARERTLDFAVSLRGKCDERPPGSNHNFITEWYGIDGPWCAMGVSYVFHKTDQEEIPKMAYTPSFANWFKEDGRFFVDDRRARRGDIAFFDFPDSLRRIQHVGFLLKPYGNGTFQTMEFNTSSGSAGSQDDGGNAYIRTRLGGDIVGWGRPRYNGNVDKPTFDFPARAWFGRGDSGADIKMWQRDLRQWARDVMHPSFDRVDFLKKVQVTGKFDEFTQKGTMTFQNMKRLDVDGRVGVHTLRVMETTRKRQERR